MRRVSNDDGAVAIIVALLSVVLFGFGALVIDVGALYSERRQLQAGADAAALAVAQSCAGGSCGSIQADAEAFADANAVDGAARATQKAGEAGGPRVCGAGATGLPVCTDPPTGVVGAGYVRVTTSTEEQDKSTLLPPALARILAPDYDGTEVFGSAVVAWGTPSFGASDFPITFDVCEWAAATGAAAPVAPPGNGNGNGGGGSGGGGNNGGGNGGNNGGGNGNTTTTVATAPATVVSDTVPDANGDVVLYMNDPSGGTALGACAANANYKDAPGAFGWVTEAPRDDECAANSKVADLLAVDVGLNIPQECPEAYLASMVGKTIFLPIFSALTGIGNNVVYKVAGYAAFDLTGFRLSGNVAAPASAPPCDNPHRCIAGRFTSAIMPRGGRIGTGPSMGATVTQLIR